MSLRDGYVMLMIPNKVKTINCPRLPLHARGLVFECVTCFVICYINSLTHKSAIKGDPPTQRMPWKQVLERVLCTSFGSKGQIT